LNNFNQPYALDPHDHYTLPPNFCHITPTYSLPQSNYPLLPTHLNIYKILPEEKMGFPILIPNIEFPNLKEIFRFISSKGLDIFKLFRKINDVIAFIRKDYPVSGATLDILEDAEVPDWKELVLTIYLRASVDEILELWDRLYDDVEIDNVVISLLPAPEP
jgi:hypothetical protein